MIRIPGDGRQNVDIVADEAPDGRGRQPHGDEHGREAEHEEDGGAEDFERLGPVGPPLDVNLVEGDAAEIGEIGRHDRQDAGRQKGQDAGQQDAGITDVLQHGGPAQMPLTRIVPRAGCAMFFLRAI